MKRADALGAKAISGLLWGVAQSWGGKLIVFLLFVILARILTPFEFGVVSAASSVLLMITQFSEFGFGDALVQRRVLEPEDINLPFFFSLILSFLLACLLFFFADVVEAWLKVEGLAVVLKVMCVIGPLTILSQFQETIFRRGLQYKQLALRVFIANSVAGGAAVVAAVGGAGVWSLVIQAVGTVVISLFWLWRRPLWRPTCEFRWKSFLELKKFAGSVVLIRVLDFASTRTVEFVIITFFGPAVLGLYSAGARLYQTLMQLFQGALSDVALSLLSRISEDRKRTAAVYLQTFSLSTLVASPVFVMIAVAAQEVCDVLLGAKWGGVESIARPLLLVGAVQCVQFINSTYLSACGKPYLVLIMGVIKSASVITSIYFARNGYAGGLIWAYCGAQLVTTPMSFWFVLNILSIPITQVVRRILPIGLGLVCAYFSVNALRDLLVGYLPGSFLRGVALCALFCLTYLVVVFSVARKQVFESIGFIRDRIKKK